MRKEVTSACNSSNRKFRRKKKTMLEIQRKKNDQRKSDRAYHEKEEAKKLSFSRLHKNIIFIGDAICEREIVFQNFFWKTIYRK